MVEVILDIPPKLSGFDSKKIEHFRHKSERRYKTSPYKLLGTAGRHFGFRRRLGEMRALIDALAGIVHYISVSVEIVDGQAKVEGTIHAWSNYRKIIAEEAMGDLEALAQRTATEYPDISILFSCDVPQGKIIKLKLSRSQTT